MTDGTIICILQVSSLFTDLNRDRKRMNTVVFPPVHMTYIIFGLDMLVNVFYLYSRFRGSCVKLICRGAVQFRGCHYIHHGARRCTQARVINDYGWMEASTRFAGLLAPTLGVNMTIAITTVINGPTEPLTSVLMLDGFLFGELRLCSASS